MGVGCGYTIPVFSARNKRSLRTSIYLRREPCYFSHYAQNLELSLAKDSLKGEGIVAVFRPP